MRSTTFMTNAEPPTSGQTSPDDSTSSDKSSALAPPTEPQIVSLLLRQNCGYGRKGTTMPHYTPDDWWECDLAYFTPSGYLTEYEVKISLQDFKADARKCQDRRVWTRTDGRNTRAGNVRYKYAAVADGQGPKHFWYCAPRGVIPLELVPDWAGLREFYWTDRYRNGSPVLHQRVLKEAPQLKGRKYPQKVLDHCRGVAYYRFIEQQSRVF